MTALSSFSAASFSAASFSGDGAPAARQQRISIPKEKKDCWDLCARIEKVGDNAALATLLSDMARRWPLDPLVLLRLALCEQHRGAYAQGLEVIDRALHLMTQANSQHVQVLSVRSALLLLNHNPSEALDVIRQALAMAQRLGEIPPLTQRSYAICLRENDFFEESYRQFMRSSTVVNRWDAAFTLLHLGRFEEGFRLYESRQEMELFCSTPHANPLPLWQGEDLSGRTIVVNCEQGAGDMMWSSRFWPELKARGGRVIYECDRDLWRLFSGAPGLDGLTPLGVLPDADFRVYAMSLPGLLGCRLESIPPPTRFAASTFGSRARAMIPEKNEMPEKNERRDLHVGIIWSGALKNPNNFRRALPLSALAPLFTLKGVTFYSLQKNPPESSETLPPGVCDLSAHLEDFADTAAVIARLDLVITVDTAVAHLAASLAVCPVWVLLSSMCYWVYFHKGAQTPWYPGMTLWRQPAAGQWPEVVERVRAQLEAWATRVSAGS